MNVPMDLFEMWLTNKNLKARTIQSYLYYFSKFTYHVFDQESVSRYLSEKSHRNIVARSFLVNYQKFLLVNHKELNISPDVKANIASVELPKLTGRTKKRIIQPIPHETIFLLEKHLKTEKDKLQLILSYFCGLRLGELLKITIISFNWEQWKEDTSKMGECRVFGKGDKEGIALVPSDIMKRVAKFIRSQDFPSVNTCIFRHQTREYNFNSLARIWQLHLAEAGVSAGITHKDPQGEIIKETAVHPHRLRHSYGTHLVAALGIDIRKVQELLRHSSIQSTQIYTHLTTGQLKEELEDFHP